MGTTIQDLPIELVIDIVKACVEYDRTNDSDTQCAALQASRTGYAPNDAERPVWNSPPVSAKKDVCNIRLVCKQFRDAAYESFGLILGYRRFRLTRIGREDLVAVGSNRNLAPWIQGLTFGCAQLGYDTTSPDNHTYLQRPTQALTESQIEQCIEDMTSEYMSESEADSDWLEDAETAIHELQTSLNSFKNLESVRVVVSDETDYLAGWLTQAQANFVRTQYARYPWKDRLWFRPSDLYTTDTVRVPQYVVRALGAAQIKIKDLRFSTGRQLGMPLTSGISIPLSSMLPTLRTLRITLDPKYLLRPGFGVAKLKDVLTHVHSNLTDLEDLALTLDCDQTTREFSAEGVFTCLQPASKLRRFALYGDWSLATKDLVTFVEQHASTVRSLILYNVILDKKWLPTLHAIADTTRDKLEYISIRSPRSATSSGDELDDFAAYGNSFPHFECVADFDVEMKRFTGSGIKTTGYNVSTDEDDTSADGTSDEANTSEDGTTDEDATTNESEDEDEDEGGEQRRKV